MGVFCRKKESIPIPEGYTAESVKVESSICTGEKTIGFYDSVQKKLMYAELVESDKDVAAFYEKYGIKK
jgi:hypothetical protein